MFFQVSARLRIDRDLAALFVHDDSLREEGMEVRCERQESLVIHVGAKEGELDRRHAQFLVSVSTRVQNSVIRTETEQQTRSIIVEITPYGALVRWSWRRGRWIGGYSSAIVIVRSGRHFKIVRELERGVEVADATVVAADRVDRN